MNHLTLGDSSKCSKREDTALCPIIHDQTERGVETLLEFLSFWAYIITKLWNFIKITLKQVHLNRLLHKIHKNQKWNHLYALSFYLYNNWIGFYQNAEKMLLTKTMELTKGSICLIYMSHLRQSHQVVLSTWTQISFYIYYITNQGEESAESCEWSLGITRTSWGALLSDKQFTKQCMKHSRQMQREYMWGASIQFLCQRKGTAVMLDL